MSVWHYFNDKKESCHTTYTGTIHSHTICGVGLRKVKKHTEFKNNVSCRRCLKILNSKRRIKDGKNKI